MSPMTRRTFVKGAAAAAAGAALSPPARADATPTEDTTKRVAKTRLPEPERSRTSPGHTTYYLDAEDGNDANEGTSPERAWQALANVNATEFSRPATGSDGPERCQLEPDSPCIGAGIRVEDNGGRDFWGNPLPADGRPDVGAHQASK